MMKKARKQQEKRRDYFAFFKQATAEAFKFLTTDFGFEYFATVEHPPDCVIKYRNKTTGISIRCEWKSMVCVSLVKLAQERAEVVEDRRYDLMLLMEIRRPEIDAHRFYGPYKEWTNDHIEKLLREYARFLTEDARDVLTGDFSIFPELKKLSAQYKRQKNKEYFGTYSGGSPRFSTHPTLEQVFAGAKDVDPELERLFGRKLDQDKTPSYIYEAYWDHKYSIREIADFLNQTEESIKQELEDYDDRG